MELLRNSLYVIETIDTNDDLDPAESLLQLADTILDGLLL